MALHPRHAAPSVLDALSDAPWEVLQPCSGSAESEGGDPDRHDDDSGEDG